MDIELLINSLNETDHYIEEIFMAGGCYKFHKFLSALYQDCVPLINIEKDHVISMIHGSYYDITGKTSSIGYRAMSDDDLTLAETWSFSKTRVLSIGECVNCDEPILL